ncbi:unnamed protein product, partial [Musa acuminata var. zebrina]
TVTYERTKVFLTKKEGRSTHERSHCQTSAVSKAKHRELFPTSLFQIQQPTTNGTVHEEEEEEEEGQSGASNRRRRPFRLENNARSDLSLSLLSPLSLSPCEMKPPLSRSKA